MLVSCISHPNTIYIITTRRGGRVLVFVQFPSKLLIRYQRGGYMRVTVAPFYHGVVEE